MRYLIFAAVILAAACSPSSWQTAFNAGATALVDGQDDREEFYASEHRRCLAESESFEAYQGCMEPATAVARTADTLDRLLRAAQAALNASDHDAFEAMIPDILRAAANLVAALQAAGLEVPSSIAALAGALS